MFRPVLVVAQSAFVGEARVIVANESAVLKAVSSATEPFVGVQAFYVASKGKNKALAQEFVTNYLTKPDLQVALYQANPRPPALTSALDQAKASDPDLQKWMDAGKGGAVLPAIPQMAAIWDPFGKAEAAVIGGADPTTSVQAAAKAISAQIK